MTLTRTTVTRVETGTKTIAGTEFSVIDQVERLVSGDRSRPRWLATRGLCNGTPASAREFTTLREALEWLGIGGGR